MRVLSVALLAPALAGAQSGHSTGSGQGGSGSSGDAASFLGTGTAEDTGAAAGGETAASGGETGTTGGDVDTAAFLRGEESNQPPIIAPPEEDPELQLVEERDKSYFLVGLRTHALFVPGFLIQAFGLEEFETVFGWALGPEFTYRRNGFDVVASIWWGSYPITTPSREDGDLEDETEIIKSTLGLVWFTVDFISGYDFEPWVSLIYGGGFGIGITTGQVLRNEAYRIAGGPWQACVGPGNPPTPQDYCEAGGHYGPVPTKAKGIWPVYPTIQGRIGARFKPLRNLVITPEFGIGVPELFTLGLRINYMF